MRLLLIMGIIILLVCIFYPKTREGLKNQNMYDSDALAVYYGQNQAFCANTWCHPKGEDSQCECPIFNNYGLAPLSSMKKYEGNPKMIVSTYDILKGVKQQPPKMCLGKYIDCYGKPCYPNYGDQSVARCQCKVGSGPFLTASSRCGPDEKGNLPNGADVSESSQGIATANSILNIMGALRKNR